MQQNFCRNQNGWDAIADESHGCIIVFDNQTYQESDLHIWHEIFVNQTKFKHKQCLIITKTPTQLKGNKKRKKKYKKKRHSIQFSVLINPSQFYLFFCLKYTTDNRFKKMDVISFNQKDNDTNFQITEDLTKKIWQWIGYVFGYHPDAEFGVF